MKRLKLIRLTEGEGATQGILLIEERILCATLELPWKSNVHSISCIPVGEYFFEKHKSPKFGDTYLGVEVPGRDGILFHIGNTDSDTNGCILLGMRWGYLRNKVAVLDSGTAFRKFMDEVRREENLLVKIVSCVQYPVGQLSTPIKR